MKKFILLFFAFISIISFAQTKEELFEVSEKIFQKSVEGDFSSVLDETYPAILQLYSKEQMLHAMQLIFNNPDFKMELINIPPNIEVSEILEKEGNKYALVSFDMLMKMTFSDDYEGDMSLMEDMLKMQSPEAEINIDEENKTLELKNRSYSYAISDDLTNHQWKLINNEKSYTDFINQYIPGDIKDKLDK